MLLYLKDEQIFPVNPPKPKNDFRDGSNFLSPTLFSLANEQGFNKLRCVCVLACFCTLVCVDCLCLLMFT